MNQTENWQAAKAHGFDEIPQVELPPRKRRVFLYEREGKVEGALKPLTWDEMRDGGYKFLREEWEEVAWR